MLLDVCYFTVIILTCFLGDAHSVFDILSSSPSKNLMAIPRKACEIPVFGDYYYLSLEGEKLDPKRCYDGSGMFAVRVVCFEDSKIITPDDFAVCFDGQWYPSKHTCVQKPCDPVYDTFSTHHTCTTRKGVAVSCRLPAEPGTKITIRCAHWRYKFEISNNITVVERFCQKNGKWQTLKECHQVCGLVFNNNNSFENNRDSFLKVNEYAWNAVIYGYIDGGWKQMCVGTLISMFHVLTAYNCIHGMKEGTLMRVAFGKYFKNLSDYDQDRVYDVLYIYPYTTVSFTILEVAEYIEYSDEVGEVCLHEPEMIGINVKVGHIATRGKDGNQFAMTLQCQTNVRHTKEITFNVLLCPPTIDHKFGLDELGGGLVSFRKNIAVLTGVLVELLGHISPIFTEIGKPQIRYHLQNLFKDFIDHHPPPKNAYWSRRRGDY